MYYPFYSFFIHDFNCHKNTQKMNILYKQSYIFLLFLEKYISMAKKLKTSEYQERIRIATRRWGRATTRPQILYPGLMDKRVRLNQFDGMFVASHPYESIVQKWKLSYRMCTVNSFSRAINIKLVDTTEDLIEACSDMMESLDLSVDTESNTSDSYLGMICTIQVSTTTTDYIIDALKLHRNIHEYLSPIFRNSSILKLFHSGNDLPILQRDFQIFCVGVINTQEAFHYLHPEYSQVSFQKMVKELCGHECNKTAQLADWRKRPLHLELQQYAAADTFYLLKCWSIMKEKLSSSLSTIPWSTSRLECLKLYTYPKQLSSQSSWVKVNSKLSVDLKAIFDTSENLNLFIELHQWRLRGAQLLDCNVQRLVSDHDLAFIGRARPQTESNLVSLCPKSRNWPGLFKEALFEEIRHHETIKLNSGGTRSVQLLEEEIVPEPKLKYMEEDFDVQFHVTIEERLGDGIISPSDCVEVPSNCVESSSDCVENSLQFLPTRNVPNRVKKMNLKHNRNLKNNLRQEQGEVPIKYKRNRGLNSRIKHALRYKTFLTSHHSRS